MLRRAIHSAVMRMLMMLYAATLRVAIIALIQRDITLFCCLRFTCCLRARSLLAIGIPYATLDAMPLRATLRRRCRLFTGLRRYSVAAPCLRFLMLFFIAVFFSCLMPLRFMPIDIATLPLRFCYVIFAAPRHMPPQRLRFALRQYVSCSRYAMPPYVVVTKGSC